MSHAGLISLESVALTDGRRLSFSAFGPRRGFPVLYMHGAIGAPLRRSPQLDAAIGSLGIRYVMVNRPGFGGSDPLPGRRVADLAADIEQLADALALERFSVVGVSAGAPYALACARRMPERVAEVAAVSPLSHRRPLHESRATRLSYQLPLRGLAAAPGLGEWVGNRFADLLRRWPELGVRLMALGASEADRRLLAVPETRAALAESFLSAMRGGGGPMVEDYLVGCGPWGFDPAEVSGPVQIWHGELDRLVPVQDALELERELPRGELKLVAEGHFFYKRRQLQILAELLGGEAGAEGPATLAA